MHSSTKDTGYPFNTLKVQHTTANWVCTDQRLFWAAERETNLWVLGCLIFLLGGGFLRACFSFLKKEVLFWKD
ncbi:predicted protein [Sclerotinia sclerotiorum 1980 UF-70]|uniref:Uncharacterized protein n=1 Tax=Sclerotinia sclerotiorum (strain ATCC 18683 / 1980 / Ss-1) TaxID=665079 RepID=A7EXL6_SCLS1|nr:predicted protein [Sclerotinia sclerotiorum 1980 UF-70]EDN94208.1 predicted protein [Sclerotinia sclerotiorum 1980 UF-70]